MSKAQFSDTIHWWRSWPPCRLVDGVSGAVKVPCKCLDLQQGGRHSSSLRAPTVSKACSDYDYQSVYSDAQRSRRRSLSFAKLD